MSKAKSRSEIRRSIHIDAPPSTVFALLTDAARMTTWLAQVVEADPRPGGVFRISDSGGTNVVGRYVEVVQDRRVVFTWGGLMGLDPGQSTVEIILEPDGDGTLVKLRHYGLPGPVIEPHDLGWEKSGLPKLKSAAEGRDPGGLCLSDVSRQGRRE